MFAKGDRVVLINGKGRSAKVGATATVRSVNNSRAWPSVDVIWDRSNPLCNTQSDGGYSIDAFELEVCNGKMPDPEFSLDEIHEAQSLIPR